MEIFQRVPNDDMMLVMKDNVPYRKLPELDLFTDAEVLTVLADVCERRWAPNPGATNALVQVLHRFSHLSMPTSVQLTQAFFTQIESISTYDAATAMLDPLLTLVHACSQRYTCLLRVFAPVLAKLVQLCSIDAECKALQNSTVLRKLAHFIQIEKTLGLHLANAGPFCDRLFELCCIKPSFSSSSCPQVCVAAFTVLCQLPMSSTLPPDVFRVGFMTCSVAEVPLSLITHMIDSCFPWLTEDALKACVQTAWKHIQQVTALLPSTVIAYCSLFARVANIVPLSLAVQFTDPHTSVFRLCTHFEQVMSTQPSVCLELSFFQFTKQAWPLLMSKTSRCRLIGALAKHFHAFSVVFEIVSLLLASRDNGDTNDWEYVEEFAECAKSELAVRLVNFVTSNENVHSANYMQAVAWMVQLNPRIADQLTADRDFIDDVAAVYISFTDQNCRVRAREILEEIAGDYFDDDEEDDVATSSTCPVVFEEGITVSEDSLCVVCLEKNTGPFVFLPCAHQFHVDCINSWFQTRVPTCPVCKHALKPGDFFSL